jgi:hypothetical protein
VDKLIFVNKNWPSNLWIGCLKSTIFAFACEVESKLMVELKAKFENEVESEDFSNLHDFI